MLISFNVENCFSFKDKTPVSLEAASIKEHQENTFTPAYLSNDYKLLKSAAIYGANSSGKSNFFKAFSFMKDFVLTSSKESQSFEEIAVQPFLLDESTENAPTTFEITFVVEDSKYRYGFIANRKTVLQEWLFVVKKRSEDNLFIRAGQIFEMTKHLKTGDLKGKIDMLTQFTRSNALFISVLSQFNIPIGKLICDWFANTRIIYEATDPEVIQVTTDLLSDAEYNRKINRIIDHANLGFSSVSSVVKMKAIQSGLGEKFLTNTVYDESSRSFTVYTKHKKYSGTKHVGHVNFDLFKNESLGAQKFFGLLGPVLLALKNGGLLFVDELDSKLHPLLLDQILRLFNSKGNNLFGAQLIFTLHNTSPLSKRLRRDQMFLIDKDEYGASTINNLNKKFPSVRNDASFEKNYLAGNFNGVPKFNSEFGEQLSLFNGEK
jgi:uncharacterized protein